MQTLIDKKTKSATLVLSEELTVARVSAIRDALQNVLEEADNLTVDVGVASEIDLSFLQLMCSAHRTGASRGKQVTLAGRENTVFSQAVVETGYLRTEGCVLDVGKNCLWVDKYHE